MGLTVLIGLPGSGKTTFCKSIGEGKSILLGYLLRQRNDSIIESCMRSGILIPSDITISVLKDNIKCDGKEEKVLDGFPRNIEQAKILESERIFVSKVIFIDTPQSICYSRLQKRGRFDDTEDCINKRFDSFYQDTLPLLNYYKLKAVPIEIINFSKD